MSSPDYRFEFSSIATSSKVTVTMPNASDVSEYQRRYNEFSFNRSIFANAAAGQYQYIVYEVGTEVVLEVGKMLLKPETGNTIIGYEQTDNSYKGYAG